LEFQDDLSEDENALQADGYGWRAQDRWTQTLREQDTDADGKKRPKVTTYCSKRNSFYKQPYNPYHIPVQNNSAKHRAKKPRLQAWENP